jgi:hypothetical protein
MIDLAELSRCFQGVVPSVVATCSRDGTPNITYLSQVHKLDSRHVVLSRQFFNKTFQNVLENPVALVEVYDALTFDSYRLSLRFVRSETEGPLFDMMSARIDAIATLTGMAGVFKLIGADVYEVTKVDRVESFLEPSLEVARQEDPIDPRGPLNELRGLQVLSHRINHAESLEKMLEVVLATLDEVFAFKHSMVLVPDERGEKLFALATYGYGERGIGAEVPFGVGVIGTVAKERRMLSISVGAELRYGRAIRQRYAETIDAGLGPEIALPGLPDASSELVLPLTIQDRLVGVLSIESVNPCAFHIWHEAFLSIIANQIAIAMDRWMSEEDDGEAVSEERCPASPAPRGCRRFDYYTNDDCIFVDGEYLIRNVPAKILWKLLSANHAEGRRVFSNRELRLDASLGLPPIKDNLESRLILLKKRLAAKCPEVRLVPTGRGRFALELDTEVELITKASA